MVRPRDNHLGLAAMKEKRRRARRPWSCPYICPRFALRLHHLSRGNSQWRQQSPGLQYPTNIRTKEFNYGVSFNGYIFRIKGVTYTRTIYYALIRAYGLYSDRRCIYHDTRAHHYRLHFTLSNRLFQRQCITDHVSLTVQITSYEELNRDYNLKLHLGTFSSEVTLTVMVTLTE